MTYCGVEEARADKRTEEEEDEEDQHGRRSRMRLHKWPQRQDGLYQMTVKPPPSAVSHFSAAFIFNSLVALSSFSDKIAAFRNQIPWISGTGYLEILVS